MSTNKLPKRKDDTKKLITAWVSIVDLQILKNHELNVSEIVRNSVKKAAASVKKK